MAPIRRARPADLPSSTDPPAYLTRLIGREAELAEIPRLLRTARLVSLVGPGGSGKTRLAAAVAARQRAGRRAVAWLDLAALREPSLVAAHVAAVLGLREPAGGSVAAALAARIGAQPLLLVLDNCEHLLGSVAELATVLLRACAGVRILATSRQALGIAGEKAWVVPPLAVPAADHVVSDSPAVQLFVERARDLLPEFALDDGNAAAVAHICRRLDGLPLAIELAAARVRLLPPAQLARRLDSMLSVLSSSSQGALPRHRTLRALIDWSYGLLTADEQRLLGRLGVFVGGFTLEAAERVAADAALPGERVLELLAGLVDRSLVSARELHGEARFGLLEMVRQYAWDALQPTGDTPALRQRHAHYCVELAELAEPHVMGGTRVGAWMARLENEHGNLRAALDWSLSTGHAEPALRLGAALLWFDFALGHFDEPRQRIRAALALAQDIPARVRARALTALGYMALWSGAVAEAQPPLEQSADLLRADAAPTDLAFTLIGLATAAGLTGAGGQALQLFDDAEAALGPPDRFAADDFPRALLFAFARYWRGTVALGGGDLEFARQCYQRAVQVARDWGSHPTIAHPLAALARVLVLQGDLVNAHAALVESLRIHAANEDRWGMVQALEAGALLALRRGAADVAVRALGGADRMRAHAGIAPTPPEAAQREQLADSARAALGDEAFRAARAEGYDYAVPRLVRLLASAAPTPAPPPAADASPPAPEAPPAAADLCVRALGGLEILVHGEPLAGEAFGSAKPRELLVFLLLHPDGCTREQVGLAFWPDASTAQVKNAFHVTLHRLRKALGHADWIVRQGTRYRVAPALRIDFDARAFREGAEAAIRAGEDAALEAALSLYRGDLLAGEPVGDWHLQVRDELARLRRSGLHALAQLRMAAERWRDAANVLRTLLATEPLDEEACRALMRCLAQLGERVESLRLYESLAALLEEELGVSPDDRTQALYLELQHAATA